MTITLAKSISREALIVQVSKKMAKRPEPQIREAWDAYISGLRQLPERCEVLHIICLMQSRLEMYMDLLADQTSLGVRGFVVTPQLASNSCRMDMFLGEAVLTEFEELAKHNEDPAPEGLSFVHPSPKGMN